MSPGGSDDAGGSHQIGGAEGGWWALERSKFIAERLAPHLAGTAVVVDLGCGRGEVVELLAGHGSTVVGVDAERFPTWSATRAGAAFVVADARRLPFRDGRVGLVTCFDVVEHFDDDAVPLGAARRLVSDGGRVAITVPSSPRLWSPFDARVGHYRRYTRATLEEATARVGLRPAEPSTYFFSWLYPVAWALRSRDRSEADEADGSTAGRVVAAAAAALAGIERLLLRRTRAPFGTSLWALYRSDAASADQAPTAAGT